MHDTAMKHAKLFFQTYADHVPNPRVLDLGAQDVNGSLREVAPLTADYVGADFIEAKGVDVVLEDAYNLPFESESFDICVSSSCFEHSEFFWLAFNEVMRVLKPHGLFYLNVPANGDFHRYPVDCWRFYPDAAMALVNWGRRSGYNPLVLETFCGRQGFSGWNDNVSVFVKDRNHSQRYKARIMDGFGEFTNGIRDESSEVVNKDRTPEDKQKRLAGLFRRLINRNGLRK